MSHPFNSNSNGANGQGNGFSNKSTGHPTSRLDLDADTGLPPEQAPSTNDFLIPARRRNFDKNILTALPDRVAPQHVGHGQNMMNPSSQTPETNSGIVVYSGDNRDAFQGAVPDSNELSSQNVFQNTITEDLEASAYQTPNFQLATFEASKQPRSHKVWSTLAPDRRGEEEDDSALATSHSHSSVPVELLCAQQTAELMPVMTHAEHGLIKLTAGLVAGSDDHKMMIDEHDWRTAIHGNNEVAVAGTNGQGRPSAPDYHISITTTPMYGQNLLRTAMDPQIFQALKDLVEKNNLKYYKTICDERQAKGTYVPKPFFLGELGYTDAIYFLAESTYGNDLMWFGQELEICLREPDSSLWQDIVYGAIGHIVAKTFGPIESKHNHISWRIRQENGRKLFMAMYNANLKMTKERDDQCLGYERLIDHAKGMELAVLDSTVDPDGVGSRLLYTSLMVKKIGTCGTEAHLRSHYQKEVLGITVPKEVKPSVDLLAKHCDGGTTVGGVGFETFLDSFQKSSIEDTDKMEE